MNRILETGDLYLREMTEDDLDSLYMLYEDGETAKYLEPLAKDRREERDKLRAYINFAYAFYGFGFWAVCHKETGEMIGRCGLNVEEIEGEVFVTAGYLMAAPWRGRGLAKEALAAVAAYSAAELGIEKIAACIAPDNRASRAVAEKTGFIFSRDVVYQGRKMLLYEMDCGQYVEKLI